LSTESFPQCGTAEDQSGTKGALGKTASTEANDLSSRSAEDCGSAEGTVGQVEERGVTDSAEIAVDYSPLIKGGLRCGHARSPPLSLTGSRNTPRLPPQRLLARPLLAFTSPDNVYSAAQYQLGVKASDVGGLPPLASNWPLESPNLNRQRVVQREDAEHRIFEHDFVARRTPARPHYKPYA